MATIAVLSGARSMLPRIAQAAARATTSTHRSRSIQPLLLSSSLSSSSKAAAAEFNDPQVAKMLHAFRVVGMEADVRAYAEQHNMTMAEVIKHVPFWRQQASQRYRERQYKPLIELYTASRKKKPDPKIVGCLVVLRCSGRDLQEALETMTDEEIQEAVKQRMTEIRALVSYGPQKQIDNAIREGRWIGGSNFSSTVMEVSNTGRISMCWGSGEEDEYTQAHSGLLFVGEGHKGKSLQLRPFRGTNNQLFMAFWDTAAGDYLRNLRTRSLLLKHPSKISLIVRRDSNGRRIASEADKQEAVQALERYIEAELERNEEIA